MISWTTLGLGGIIAAITAGWQHVKSTFVYMSSFVFVKATYDYQLSPAIHAHIKRNYRPLPSGLLNYVSLRLKMRDRKEDALVPFRVPAQTSVYIKGFKVLFVHVSERVEIRSLRGLLNFDEFTSEALDTWDRIRANRGDRKQPSRFYVSKVIGEEKFGSSMERSRRVHSGNEISEGEAPTASGSSGLLQADISIDRSFKYAPEMYTITNDDDPFDGLYFDESVSRYFDQAKRWYNMGDWYLDRHIPWRRGWLLHGPGGTGKSSIAKAVAQMMGVPVYHFYLATLSDQEFISQWDNMATPCVALLEDFDTVFKGRENVTAHKSLTFDCVLNQISGVTAINGVFLIVTTNHLEHIDPAMGVESDFADGISTRPGRIDSVIEVGYINEANRRRMANRILRDWPDLIESVMKPRHTGNVTPIQWQENLIQKALARMQEEDQARLDKAGTLMERLDNGGLNKLLAECIESASTAPRPKVVNE